MEMEPGYDVAFWRDASKKQRRVAEYLIQNLPTCKLWIEPDRAFVEVYAVEVGSDTLSLKIDLTDLFRDAEIEGDAFPVLRIIRDSIDLLIDRHTSSE
jgi:hypothetical protein